MQDAGDLHPVVDYEVEHHVLLNWKTTQALLQFVAPSAQFWKPKQFFEPRSDLAMDTVCRSRVFEAINSQISTRSDRAARERVRRFINAILAS